MILRDQIFRAELSFTTSFSVRSRLLKDLGWLLYHQGRYKAAEDVVRRLVEGFRNNGGRLENNEDMRHALDLLSDTFASQGLYEQAEGVCQSLLRVRKKILGSEHAETLRNMTMLGHVLVVAERYTEAEKIIKAALIIRTDLFGPYHQLTLRVASVHAQILSISRFRQRQETEIRLRAILEVQNSCLGPEHEDTLWTASRLIKNLYKLGKYAESTSIGRALVAMRRRNLGSEHPITLSDIKALGYNELANSNPNCAEDLFYEALEGTTKVLGRTHIDTIDSMIGLSMALHSLKRYKEAEALFHEAVELSSQTLWPGCFVNTHALDGLGQLLIETGRLHEAESTFQRILINKKRHLGEDDPDTLRTLDILGYLYSKMARYNEAEVFCLRARDGALRVLGPEDPDTRLYNDHLEWVQMFQQEQYDTNTTGDESDTDAMDDAINADTMYRE